MFRKFHRLLIFIFIGLILLPVYSEAIKVVSWNICAFPGTTGTSREGDFRKVLEQLQPDILVVQEMVNQFGLDQFLNNILNHSFPDTYGAAPFFDSTYSDNALFYKKSVIRIISHQQITTALRDISEYYLEILEGPEKGTKFRIYSVHLKAGSSPSDKEKRDEEAKILRDFLNGLPKNSLFLVCGTFYMQSSKENAFKILTGRQKDNDGRTKDPLGTKGKWPKRKHRLIQTQSTRTSNFGGGYGGGLDDRFDLILTSYGFKRSEELAYVADSYVAYGNDGKHFNKAVNDGKNKSVSNDIADALYEASDHLPVIIELKLPEIKPKPGDWSSKTDFGKFEFAVSPGSDGIKYVKLIFSNWRGRSGWVSITPSTPWAISNSKFDINVSFSLDPWNPWNKEDWTFKGTFSSSKKASGTWKAVISGGTYSGSWTAKPKK